MDILSLDILQSLKLILSPWRWLRRKPSEPGELLLRYNIGGLDIIVINREGRIITSSFQGDTERTVSPTHDFVEMTLLNLVIERSIESNKESGKGVP